MSSPATISIDNDFATGQPGVALRTTNNEAARRLDLKCQSGMKMKRPREEAEVSLHGRWSYHPTVWGR